MRTNSLLPASLILLPLLLLPFPRTAHAFGESHIGLFADEDATYCGAAAVPYTPATVYVLAYIGSEISGLTAVEFRIDNIPPNPGYPVGQITASWNTNLVIGEPANGIALAFQTAQYGPYVPLGNIDFLAFADNWIDTDHRMVVMESFDSGLLAIVDGGFTTISVWGGRFTFNCSSDGNCSCGVGSSADASWGEVKSLY